jgi:putative GTP pyrophosphokinase
MHAASSSYAPKNEALCGRQLRGLQLMCNPLVTQLSFAMTGPSTDRPDFRILQEYDLRARLLVDFNLKLAHLIVDILAQEAVRVHSVTSRVKTRESLARKLARPDKAYTSLADVTDLCGIRVITYFEDDVDRVASLIAREFEVDQSNSVDKRAALDPDRFGYLSLHHVVRLSLGRSQLTEYRRFNGYAAEIQTRSILQHAWAEIEHDLGYKSRLGVPRDIRRRFSRLAGLLEIVDLEFTGIRDQLAEYERNVPRRIVDAPELVGIDQASLEAYVASSEVLRRIDLAIAAVAGAELETGDSDYLEGEADRLQLAGITSIAFLDETLIASESLIVRLAQAWIESRYNTVSAGIGLFYLWYLLISASYDKEAVKAQLDAYNVGDDRDALAERLLTVVRRLRQ